MVTDRLRAQNQFLAGIPLSTLLSGYVVTWFGLHATILFMGALYLVATLSLLLNLALRRMEKPTPRDREEGKSR